MDNNNNANALGLVIVIITSIVIAAAATLLFAFGFFPLLFSSVVYINVTSIVLFSLALIFAFVLYLRHGYYCTAVSFDLQALSVLSAISVLLAAIAAAFSFSPTATSSLILVFFASLFFASSVFTAVKLVTDLLNSRHTHFEKE